MRPAHGWQRRGRPETGFAWGEAVAAVLALAALAVARAVAAPAVELAVDPRTARPGEFLRVRVSAPGEGLVGEYLGTTFRLFPAGGRMAGALVAVPYTAGPGEEWLVVKDAAGRELARRRIAFVARSFPVQRLAVTRSQENLVRPQDPATAERRGREDQEVADARRSSSDRRLWSGPFLWPLPGPARITSEFGLVREVNGVVTGRHSGLDLAAAQGTPVHASANGRVVLARDHLLTGKTVILDHGWGLSTSYLHLDSMRVQEGENVDAGQVIGHVGQTGLATGPHLHWAAHLPGGFFDPRLLIQGDPWPQEQAAAGR